MASEETAIEVTDFEFHALRKVRLSSAPLIGDASKRLAVSSAYGLGVTIIASNRLLSFLTTDVHAHKPTRTNINEEVTNLRTRTTVYFDEQASLLAVSCNCDGSFVGVLADTAAGPMVHVFDAAAFSPDYQGHISPISAIRVSADAGAAARCFEWSPAAADTLVAAASDRSLMTVVVKTESSSYSVVCEKKLGAAVRAISWSRKGKQLVVGDDLGKVIQMKPELDIVRSTMPPDSCAIPNPAVVGLCWMTTTEFLVVYGSTVSKDVDATIMITKKDKPITWTSLPDLGYGSTQATLPPAVHSLCLLDWNVVLTTSTKSSEVGVVGKAAELWQTWICDDLCQAALPTTAAVGAETFPVGAELDLSGVDPLVLSEDGQKRAPPSPILMVLTTDGVLMSYHAVSTRAGAPSLQVPRKAINPAAIRVGPKPLGAGGQTVAAGAASAAPAAAAATPTTQTSLFGAAATPAAAAAAATPTAKTSLFGATTPAAAAPAAQQSTPALFAALQQAPICSPNVKPAGTPAAAGSLFGAAAPAAAAAAPAAPAVDAAAAAAAQQASAEEEARKKKEAERAEKERKLVEDRGKVNALLQAVQNEATALVDEMARMAAIVEKTRPAFTEMEMELKVKEASKLHDMDGYVRELRETETRQERQVKAAVLRVSDRLRMVDDAAATNGGGALATLRRDYDYDREESMTQLGSRVAAARSTLSDVQQELHKLRLPQVHRGYQSDAKWTSEREENVKGTIKNIQKIVRCEREKVEDVEALVRNVVQLKMSDDEARKEKAGLERAERKEDDGKIIIVKKKQQQSGAASTSAKERTPTEQAEMRKRLLNAKTLFPHPGPRPFIATRELDGGAAAAYLLPPAAAKPSLNQSLSSSFHGAAAGAAASPLRAQLEERLLEITKPRKAIQLPNLEKFAIKQESRPQQLLPSPIVAKPAAPAAAFVGGAAAVPKAAPAFRLPDPQATSTPLKPAAPAAPAAAAPAAPAPSLFGKSVAPAAPAAAAATPTLAAKEAEKPSEPEVEKAVEAVKTSEPATSAAPAATAATPPKTSIFGGGATTPAANGAAAPSIFGKPAAAAPAADATKPASSIFGGAAASPTPAAAAAASTAPAASTASSIFGGGIAAASAAPATTTTNTTSSFFGSPAPSSSPFGAAAAAAQPATKSIFGGSLAAPAASSSSPFGAAAAAAVPTSPAATTTTSSIFGGGVSQPQPQQQASSPFGSFGKPAVASGASSFSFKSAAAAAATEAQQQPAASGFGSGFGQAAAAPSTSVFGGASSGATSAFGSFGASKPAAAGSFAAAAAAAAADEGMDDGGSSTANFGGGGGFMGGLGSSTSANAGKNVFGGGFGQTTNTSAASSIFGKSTSTFGAKPAFGSSPSAFGGGTSSAFGGGAFGAGASSPQSSSAFGSPSAAPSTGAFGKPAFGSGPTFGAKSVFGGGAAQQQPQHQQNAFGGGAAASGGGGGFAAFANQGGGFGSVAAAAGQQQQSTIFGGGVAQAKPAGSSIFGGGTTTGTTKQFSSWR